MPLFIFAAFSGSLSEAITVYPLLENPTAVHKPT